MKTLRLWVTALIAPALLFLQPLFAFDNAPEETEPPLSLVFPFAQHGEQVVTTEDVLVNSGCIIPGGAVFLTIFVPPRPEDLDVKKQAKDKSFTENAYSRSVTLPDKKDRLSPLQKAAFDRATRDPWKSQMVYRAAMKQYRFDEMRLVFTPPGSSSVSLEAFNLPDGMLLGGDKSQVTVLALEKESAAVKAGVVPGAVVLKVNGRSIASLNQFQDIYYAEKKATHDAGKPLELTVQMPKGGETKTLTFVPPRKLALDDFFSASDVSAEPAKKPEPATPVDPALKAPPAPDPNPVTPLAP